MKNTVTILRERLFSIIRRLVEEPERYARKPGRDFTRKRTLTPAVLIQLIVTMDEKGIQSTNPGRCVRWRCAPQSPIR